MLWLVRYESQRLNGVWNEGTASLFCLWGRGYRLEESFHEEESGVYVTA